jgi:hypothetical protein
MEVNLKRSNFIEKRLLDNKRDKFTADVICKALKLNIGDSEIVKLMDIQTLSRLKRRFNTYKRQVYVSIQVLTEAF